MGVALPIITAVTALASTAVGVYSSYEQQRIQQKNIDAQNKAAQAQAEAQRQQAQYDADMAAYNAQVAEGNAQLAEAEGRVEKKAAYEESLEKRQQAAQIVGQQRAAQAAGGVQVDSGSSLDLNLDTAEKGELDAFMIREQGYWKDYNKQVEAWNFRNEAAGLESQSSLYTNQASNITAQKIHSSNTFLPNAAGSLLSGVSNAASNYHIMTKK